MNPDGLKGHHQIFDERKELTKNLKGRWGKTMKHAQMQQYHKKGSY